MLDQVSYVTELICCYHHAVGIYVYNYQSQRTLSDLQQARCYKCSKTHPQCHRLFALTWTG